MDKKYHIVEIDKEDRTILWVKVLTRRAAYEALDELKLRFPFKKLVIEVR